MSARCATNILEFKDTLISPSIHALIQSPYSSQCCDSMHCRMEDPLSLSIQPQTPKFSKRGSNGSKISWKTFQIIWKLLEFPKSEPLNRNFGNSRMKISRKIVFVNLAMPLEVFGFFLGNYVNSHCFLFSTSSFDGDHSKRVFTSWLRNVRGR